MQNLRLSRSVLIQLMMVTLIVVALAVYFSDMLSMIYFSHQQTSAGYALNGLIVVLFFLAMGRVLALLVDYNREELALNRFQHNLDGGPGVLLDAVAPASIIAVRVGMMEGMRLKHAPIHHQALAATLLAAESTRTALIRFIHNIMILCGVLGTIISLSIALFGASDMLEQAVSSTGMGMVIHGMSTALSTTMSAILCYLILAYFLAAVQNLQTRFLGRVEELTTTHLLPMYQLSGEAVSRQAVDLVREAHALIEAMNKHLNQLDLKAMTEEMQQGRIQLQQLHADARQQAQVQHDALREELRQLAAVMKDGFRLPGV